MSKHTEGPWAVSQNTSFVFGQQQGPGLLPLGFIYGPSFAEDSDLGRRALADTRLCAAAPDLLEALQKYVAAGFGNSTDPYLQGQAYDAAIEAIARALGEKP